MSVLVPRRARLTVVASAIVASAMLLSIAATPALANGGGSVSFTPDSIGPGQSTAWYADPAAYYVQAYYLDGDLLDCFFQLGVDDRLLTFETLTSPEWFGEGWTTLEHLLYSREVVPVDINGYPQGCPTTPDFDLAVTSATLTLVTGEEEEEQEEQETPEPPALANTGAESGHTLVAGLLAIALGIAAVVTTRRGVRRGV